MGRSYKHTATQPIRMLHSAEHRLNPGLPRKATAQGTLTLRRMSSDFIISREKSGCPRGRTQKAVTGWVLARASTPYPPHMLQLLENSCPEHQQPAGNSSGLWNAELTLGFVWKSLAFVEQTPRRQSPWKSHYNCEILF